MYPLSEQMFGILGVVIGILGIVIGVAVAWYFYRKAIKDRRPTFAVDPVNIEILRKENVADAPIVVQKHSGEEISGSLFATKFYFWNGGRESIRRDHVLQEIKLCARSEHEAFEILDVRILMETRPEIVRFNILSSSGDTRCVEMDFNILELNDGIAGQILFIGDPETNFYLTGAIEGVEDFFGIPTSPQIREYMWDNVAPAFVFTFGPWGLTFVGIFLGIWISEKFGMQMNVLPILTSLALILCSSLILAVSMHRIRTPKLARSAVPKSLQKLT